MLCLVWLTYKELAKMLALQNIIINLTHEKLWTIFDVIEDFMDDSDTKFVVKNEKNNEEREYVD